MISRIFVLSQTQALALRAQPGREAGSSLGKLAVGLGVKESARPEPPDGAGRRVRKAAWAGWQGPSA